MNFKEQEKLLDIEWFEGPMMSLFLDKKGALFIYKWMDVTSDGHTWLVFRTTQDLLAAYVQQVISEKALILLAPDKSWYLVDINPELNFSNQRTLSTVELKKQALPETHTFFNEANCPEPAKLQAFMPQELIAA
ncbi:MAG: hypothetical protein MUC59_06930 [Saprospiraceae bacterium]|jgi:hypothetical protein|nr:hypothetical protein [Saprospiraceae bacterium]